MSDYESVCEVRGGNLILRGIQNTVLPNDTAPYLTGGVYTKGKRTFDFGRLEIRAKLVGAQGAHSGIWMFPADDSGIKGGKSTLWSESILINIFIKPCIPIIRMFLVFEINRLRIVSLLRLT